MKKLLLFVLFAVASNQLLAMKATTQSREAGTVAPGQVQREAIDRARQAAQQHLDLYGIIGIDEAATTDEIETAWRRRHRELYRQSDRISVPLTRLNQAYYILKNPRARAVYDRAMNFNR